MAIEFDPAEISRALDAELTDVTRRIAFATAQACVLATPVGNPTLWQRASAPPGYTGGHARRNWQISLRYAIQTALAGTDASGAGTLARAQAQLRTFDARFVPRLYLVNNAPYIGRLNDGHSTQAPRGFVEAAIAKGTSVRLPQRKSI